MKSVFFSFGVHVSAKMSGRAEARTVVLFVIGRHLRNDAKGVL